MKERIDKNENRRRDMDENVGYVSTSATSFAEMEEIAKQQPEAKGVIWSRGAHRLEDEMNRWADAQEETIEHFSREQLFVKAAAPGRPPATQKAPPACGDIDCVDSDCEGKDHDHDDSPPSKKRKVDNNATVTSAAWPEEVRAACARVMATLPEAFREPMQRDAEEMAMMLLRLCPGALWLTVQVEVIALRVCSRWHQDNYTGRAVITYTGPGTWCADDAHVRFDQFEKTLGKPKEVSDPRIVPDFERVHKPRPNAVVLIKGKSWPDIRGYGLTHKAPNLRVDADGEPELKRLMLKVDLAQRRPGN